VTDSREELGRLVRAVWTEWAQEQPDPRPSWLTDWEDLDDGQREVDMRIGSTVAAVTRATAEAQAAMPTLSGVYARPSGYDVSVFPDAMREHFSSALDASTWKITVEARGPGTWGVCFMGRCLGISGEWDREPIPSSRDDQWLEDHRFPLATALDLAREWAPKIRVNGMTAAEILERHRA
jgi:hypothetical protein